MYNKKKLSQIILSGLMAVSFSSISLPIEAADMGLHVDQVGYLPNYSKVAMVTDSNDTTFEIIDTKDNKVVFKGIIVLFPNKNASCHKALKNCPPIVAKAAPFIPIWKMQIKI